MNFYRGTKERRVCAYVSKRGIEKKRGQNYVIRIRLTVRGRQQLEVNGRAADGGASTPSFFSGGICPHSHPPPLFSLASTSRSRCLAAMSRVAAKKEQQGAKINKLTFYAGEQTGLMISWEIGMRSTDRSAWHLSISYDQSWFPLDDKAISVALRRQAIQLSAAAQRWWKDPSEIANFKDSH